MNEKRANRIERAKRTWFGRMVCRLLGEERGAVAMEYVVIALLVAAAVVGIVIVFGDNIAKMFGSTTRSLTGTEGVKEAGEDRAKQAADVPGEVKGALEAGKEIRQGEAADFKE